MVGVLHQVKTGSRFTANSVDLMRRLSTSGMGIILVPEGIVADDLAAERLVRALPQWHGKPMPVHALTETRLLPAKTQRFIEVLQGTPGLGLITSWVGRLGKGTLAPIR